VLEVDRLGNSSRPGGDPVDERLDRFLAALVEGEGHEVLKESLAEARVEARKVLTSKLAQLLIDDATREIDRALENRSSQSVSREPTQMLEQAESETRANHDIDGTGDADLVYVYGVGDFTHGYEGGMPGIVPQSEVTRLERNGLVAFISAVPPGEFGESTLPENLNDIDWLRDRATSHQTVLSDLGEHGPIVPMRFCTLYASEERVEELLETRQEILHRALESVRDRSEWGVKVICDLDALFADRLENFPPATQETSHGSGEGTRYLVNRKLQEDSQNRAAAYASQIAERLHETLEHLSVASTELPPQSQELRGDDSYMPFNASYLVANERRDDFLNAVRAFHEVHSGGGLSIEATGPWAPFTFVTIDLTEGRIDEPA
jgi:hypothetical protein